MSRRDVEPRLTSAAPEFGSRQQRLRPFSWIATDSDSQRGRTSPACARSAGRREADERDIRDESGKRAAIAETVRVIFHALIIALVIRTFLFQPFNIPSGSMKETLLVGDYLFVSKYSYGYSHYSSAVLAAAVLRPHLGVAARPRRRRRVPAAEGRLHRLHQARDRPARRPHPDDRRACSTSTASRSSASASRTSSRPRKARAPRASSDGARRCRTA